MDPGLINDLTDEQDALDRLLAGLPANDWKRPTPAAGWTVADSVRHLATSETAAAASVRDGRDPRDPSAAPLPLPDVADGLGLLKWWRESRAHARDALAGCDDSERVPWGGRAMAARSLATARLMECWAHGLDCFAAAEVEPVDTDRIRHIAWLGWRSLPYAFTIAGEQPPAPTDRLAVQLESPSGESWPIGAGADSALATVSGAAGVWCRVVTQRWRAAGPPPLRTEGPLAVAAVRVARAYLSDA